MKENLERAWGAYNATPQKASLEVWKNEQIFVVPLCGKLRDLVERRRAAPNPRNQEG